MIFTKFQRNYRLHDFSQISKKSDHVKTDFFQMFVSCFNTYISN